MAESSNQSTAVPGGKSAGWRWVLGLAAGGVLWFDASSGLTTAILWISGLYALWNWRRTLAAWRNPAGILFGLGVLWALASLAWSFNPAGSARDLIKTMPMALGVLAMPAVFDRPGRIWTALVASAAMVTLVLAADLARLIAWLGWPWVLEAARFLHPYLYTHPNVSSMMAGLCAMVFTARGLAGAPGAGRKALLAAGILLDLAYLVVMASRGPQIVFALAALAAPVALLPGWRARLVAAVLAGVIGAGLWWGAGIVNPRFKDRTMGTFNHRDTVWGHAKMLADQRPVLGYGYGKKAFYKAVYANPAERAPLVPVRYPHPHSYWLMLYFQGGAAGFLFWSLGWLLLGARLGRYANRQCRAATGWVARLRARLLPALLGTGIVYILVYGIGDYPDHVIRHTLFYLAGLTMALTVPPRPGAVL